MKKNKIIDFAKLVGQPLTIIADISMPSQSDWLHMQLARSTGKVHHVNTYFKEVGKILNLQLVEMETMVIVEKFYNHNFKPITKRSFNGLDGIEAFQAVDVYIRLQPLFYAKRIIYTPQNIYRHLEHFFEKNEGNITVTGRRIPNLAQEIIFETYKSRILSQPSTKPKR